MFADSLLVLRDCCLMRAVCCVLFAMCLLWYVSVCVCFLRFFCLVFVD